MVSVCSFSPTNKLVKGSGQSSLDALVGPGTTDLSTNQIVGLGQGCAILVSWHPGHHDYRRVALQEQDWTTLV